MLKIQAACISHKGKVREKNEDNFVFFGSAADVTGETGKVHFRTSALDRYILLGVFDGMGGTICGERASQIAAECAMNFCPSSETDIRTALMDLCYEANEKICNEMVNVVNGRMGSTASMLCFGENCCTLCNIGDSPVFLLREGKLFKISHDHTEYDNYVKIMGHEPPPGKKFKLTQHLGIFSEEMDIEPFTAQDSIYTGDRFLICSDGVTDMLSEEELIGALGGNLSADKKAEMLLAAALYKGGKDNITAICIEIS